MYLGDVGQSPIDQIDDLSRDNERRLIGRESLDVGFEVFQQRFSARGSYEAASCDSE